MKREDELNIDLGLAVLSVLIEPGQIITRDAIAEVCGCNVYRIDKLEKTALEKFKRRAQQRGLDDLLNSLAA